MAIPGNFLSSTTESVDPNISGWTTKLNCTLSKGTGGRNGDGCLVVKSVATGQMQARTLSSYTVTPGTTYYAFADAAGVSSERIGIRWLNASGTEISITWSVTTTGSSSGWHRVSVAGEAPWSARQAQVILSSTEAGALVTHYWENVYLGLPIRTNGNLLPFGTESTEIDATGWTAVVNASLSRQVPVVSWAVDNFTAGGHTLAMTAVAAGNASVLAVDRPAVTPGTEYLAYAYLQPPTNSSVAWIELRFYDVNGNQVGVQRSTLAPPTPATGMYRQRASMVAPANAATCSVAAGLDGASAGQVLRLETVVVTVAPSLQAGTVLPYADGSFEQGVAGWTVTAGVATAARTTPWGLSFFDGAYSLAVTSATATASTVASAKWPVTEGDNWRGQVLVHSAAGSWSSVRVRLRWFDAANADLGASTGIVYALPGASWYALPADAVAPAGATQAAVEVVATASSVASVLHIDQAALWQVLPLTEVSAVSAGGYTVLTLRELLVGDEVSVYRELADGSRTLVRGEAGLIDRQTITSDLLIVEDHEAPLNVPVRYYIEQHPPGSLTAATRYSDYVTVAFADINEAWLKDPANPQRNVKVLVHRPPDWAEPIQQAVHKVRGRRNAVILSDTRGGPEGDLAVWTRSDEERIALDLLLSSGNTLLWQVVPGMGESDMYVNVGQITRARVSPRAQELWREWTLPLVEADMPTALGISGPAGRTCQDIVTEWATCADLLPVYATSEDLLLDRRR